ncbi:MAG: hypothetical protein AAAC48_11960 [Phyllobacterium sp.]|uniref:hypothetical protein n=1 Tax=Phyllobacterium sp. TaxID=1871046 RepID=UPI0030F30170
MFADSCCRSSLPHFSVVGVVVRASSRSKPSIPKRQLLPIHLAAIQGQFRRRAALVINTRSTIIDGRGGRKLTMTITRPHRPRSDHKRFDHCQMAIEDELIELVGRACDAGWHRDEVLSAILEITDNLSLARREDLAINIAMHVAQLMKKRDV